MHNASNYFFKSVPHRLKHVPFMYQLRAIALIFICFFPLLLEEDASAGEDVPVDGGRLVLGTIGEPSNLNPYISTDSASHDVADLLFIAPIRYNKNLELEPFACKSWAMSEDGLRLTLHMNQGIRWEDGEELTADDVVFTARMAADPKVGSPYAEDFLHIASITAPDRYTVEVVYSSYYARALETFTSAILPKHILEGKDVRASDFSRRPVGAGPYRLKSWESGSRLTLVASPTYFQGRPHIDEVIYRVIPDSGTMFMEARSGRIDLMGLSPEQYLCQTNTPWWEKNFHKYRYLASVYVYLGFNMDHPFFKDVRVRRAISMAISREDLVKGALLGQGVPAIGPYKPGTAFFHPTLKPVKQNVTEARRLLREAGFEDRDGDGILEKDGKPFAFTILTNQGNSERILVSIIIQNQLRRVGIDVRVRTVEWAAFIPSRRIRTSIRSGIPHRPCPADSILCISGIRSLTRFSRRDASPGIRRAVTKFTAVCRRFWIASSRTASSIIPIPCPWCAAASGGSNLLWPASAGTWTNGGFRRICRTRCSCLSDPSEGR